MAYPHTFYIKILKSLPLYTFYKKFQMDYPQKFFRKINAIVLPYKNSSVTLSKIYSMSETTINVYSDGTTGISGTGDSETLAVLKQLLILSNQSFSQLNLKLENMAKTLEDVSTQVADLQTTVEDVTTKNAAYVKTLNDANDSLEKANADLKAQVDAASNGGTVLDPTKVQAISTQLDNIKSMVNASLLVPAPPVTDPVPDPTPVSTPDPTPDPVPPAETTPEVPVVDTTGSATSTDTTGSTEIPASTDPNVNPW